MSINERLNPPLWIEQLGITPLPTIYGWANAETGEMLYRVRNIPNPDLSYIFNAKQRKILESGGLRFVPTGAVESVDGEYQRFTYDGAYTFSIMEEGVTYQIPVWHADLPEPAGRGRVFQIAVRLPQGAVDLYIANANFSDVFFAETRPFNRIALELRSEDMQGVPSSLIGVIDHATPANSVSTSLDPMPAGSLIVLNVSDVSIDYVSPVGNGSLPIPANFFSNAPNVIAYAFGESTENVAVLSVKISVVE